MRPLGGSITHVAMVIKCQYRNTALLLGSASIKHHQLYTLFISFILTFPFCNKECCIKKSKLLMKQRQDEIAKDVSTKKHHSCPHFINKLDHI